MVPSMAIIVVTIIKSIAIPNVCIFVESYHFGSYIRRREGVGLLERVTC
jgi:hypothetical protein